MIPGFRDKSYEDGLRILRLDTLEERRNRADLKSLQDVQGAFSSSIFETLFQFTIHEARQN